MVDSINSDSCAGCIIERCNHCKKEPCPISERVCELCTENKKNTDEYENILNKLKDCQKNNLYKKKDSSEAFRNYESFYEDNYLDNEYL